MRRASRRFEIVDNGRFTKIGQQKTGTGVDSRPPVRPPDEPSQAEFVMADDLR
jgi:hypothetical protein